MQKDTVVVNINNVTNVKKRLNSTICITLQIRQVSKSHKKKKLKIEKELGTDKAYFYDDH